MLVLLACDDCIITRIDVRIVYDDHGIRAAASPRRWHRRWHRRRLPIIRPQFLAFSLERLKAAPAHKRRHLRDRAKNLCQNDYGDQQVAS